MNFVRSSSMWFASLILITTLFVIPSPTLAQEEIYPTDQCVSDKLDAAATQCRRVLKAWAKFEKGGDKDKRKKQLGKAAAALSDGWSEANDTSKDAGVKCKNTTVDAESMSGIVGKYGKRLAKAVRGGGAGGSCSSKYLKVAADYCRAHLEAEGAHIAGRDTDRDRAILDGALSDADSDFEIAWGGVAEECPSEFASEDAGEVLDELFGRAMHGATVSPKLAVGEWKQITPKREVDYAGNMLDPQCWDGSDYHFFVRGGTENKLVMYYEGGGACWDALSCGGTPLTGPIFKSNITTEEQINGVGTGLADFENPENPFSNWNVVYVPYCTGDVHWGNNTFEHVQGTSSIVIQHKGWVNGQVAEKYAREHIVSPEKVFVTGSSAGAYGAIVNSVFAKENAYPSTPFAVVGDAGNGVITEDFLENDLAKWGIENNLPTWIEAIDVDLTDLNAADLWAESAAHYPDSRYATYTSAYDGGTGGQTGFFNVMQNIDNVTLWGSWWNASCEWNEEMNELNADAAERADNFRFYVGSGSRHTIWGNDKVYSDTTGGVPTFVSWIDDMLEGTDEEWESASCDDCSTLLDGDPRPPFEGETRPFPFDVEGQILCEEDEI